MKKYKLDFSEIKTAAGMHQMMARACGFPEHYGANLDALWDCLSGDLETPAEFIITGKESALKVAAASEIFKLLEEYAAENPGELKLVYR